MERRRRGGTALCARPRRDAVRYDRSVTSTPALSRAAFLIIFAVSFAVQAGNLGLQSVLPAIGRQVGIADPLIAGIFSLSALLSRGASDGSTTT